MQESESPTSMRSESNGVEPTRLSQLVQGEQVSVHVVCIVGVGWVVLQVPLCRGLHMLGWPPLWLALIIHHVQTHNLHTSMLALQGAATLQAPVANKCKLFFFCFLFISMLSLQGGCTGASNVVGMSVLVAAVALPHTLETGVPVMSMTTMGHSVMHTEL